MGYILNIDTAGKNCSVALAKEGRLVTCKELESEQYVHSEKLHLFIAEVLESTGVSVSDLAAIAVVSGPGSYTGLRIGVSAAKGMAYSLSVPLIAVSSLESLCLMARSKGVEGYLCPMIDARRMEVYTFVCDGKDEVVECLEAVVVDADFFLKYKDIGLSCFGDGAEKCRDVIFSSFEFVDNIKLSASNIIERSYQKYLASEHEDVAYFEPEYLKSFVAGLPKKIF